jgi:osmotically-inducible protein OsmY
MVYRAGGIMERALIVTLAFLTAAACAPEAPQARPAAAAQTAKKAPPQVPVVAPAPVAEAAPEPKADPNKELAKRVMRALEDEGKIHAAAIDVTAAGGVVTLWGTAASPDEKQRASRVAYRVNGVTAVQNKLAIASGS